MELPFCEIKVPQKHPSANFHSIPSSPCHIFLLLHDLLYSLALHFLRNPCLDAPILFLGNLFSDLTIRWVATKDVRVEDCHSRQGGSQDLPHQVVVGPRHGSQNQVKKESPNRVEQKAKVDSNHDTEKFELRFEAANQQATAASVNRQHKGGNRRYSNHQHNLMTTTQGRHRLNLNSS